MFFGCILAAFSKINCRIRVSNKFNLSSRHLFIQIYELFSANKSTIKITRKLQKVSTHIGSSSPLRRTAQAERHARLLRN